jgi:hypothetical protein
LFRCLFIVQWDFCLAIVLVQALYLRQCNPSPWYFLALFPHPVLCNSF